MENERERLTGEILAEWARKRCDDMENKRERLTPERLEKLKRIYEAMAGTGEEVLIDIDEVGELIAEVERLRELEEMLIAAGKRNGVLLVDENKEDTP